MKQVIWESEHAGIKIIGLPVNQQMRWVGVAVDCGSMSEQSDELGYAHFIEHLTFSDNELMDGREFLRAIEGIGAVTNAWTSRDTTMYYASAPPGHATAKAAGLLMTALLRPQLTAENTLREAGVIRQEIQDARDNPAIRAWAAMAASVFSGGSAGHAVLGTTETVTEATPATLSAFRDRYYKPRAMTMFYLAPAEVLGEELKVVEAEVHKVLRDSGHTVSEMSYGGRLQESQVSDFGRPRYEEETNFEQSTYYLAIEDGPLHGAGESYADILRDAVLGSGMSSYFFDEIREQRGLAYAIGAGSYALAENGMFLISASTQPSQLEELEHEVLSALTRAKTEAFTPDAIERSKNRACAAVVADFDSARRLVHVYRERVLLMQGMEFELSMEADCNALMAVTHPQLMESMDKLLQARRATVVLKPVAGAMAESRHLDGITAVVNETRSLRDTQ